ncbi:mCG147759 [Mus musculus]|jgi:hypothetical protein|uniref:Uncharacterized protein n=1 Tax=Mus musculus TaxID=10090 RepID=Q9D971_MOUSE|nr:mCG147759 [Mus musculus]BAB24948.1 unnamed protein product [Mus musculus]
MTGLESLWVSEVLQLPFRSNHTSPKSSTGSCQASRYRPAPVPAESFSLVCAVSKSAKVALPTPAWTERVTDVEGGMARNGCADLLLCAILALRVPVGLGVQYS